MGGWSQETKILDNYFSKNFISISLDGEKNQIENNKIEDGDFGINLAHTIKYYTLKNNILNNNRCSFQCFPLNQDALTNEIDKSNLINGKSIYFLKNVSNQIFDEVQDMATFYCLDCQNIVLKNLKLSNNGYGIYLFNNKDSKIENVDTSYNCYTGIGIFYSSNITVSSSTSSFNDWYGIRMENSYESKILNSIFEFNKGSGILLSGFWIYSKHLIAANRITNNKIGISVTRSEENKIEKNHITSNYEVGIFISSTHYGTISENNISENAVGIALKDGSVNSIFKNKFYNNYFSALGTDWGIVDEIYENDFKGKGRLINFNPGEAKKIFHNNFFFQEKSLPLYYHPIHKPLSPLDDGYPSGGNYWSDYQEEDKKSGENQDQEGSDGIGDTPYCVEIDSTKVCDRYPFLKPYGWLHLPNVLISEVYYDVANDKGKEGDNEWVIIHNLEEKEINLFGWQICDNESCDTLPEIILPPKSYAIISPTSSTFNYWKIPKDMVKIVLESKIGNGLSNDGDRLILKDKDGNIIDALSYGKDDSIFDLPAIDVKEGKSLLRYPPERDTDSAKDFIESNPTIENQPPIPIFNFSPKNPIKGIEVKFDASNSFDPDGKITKFEWQINSTTLFGTTTAFVFNENGEYEITLIVSDEDSYTSSTSTILKVEPFSFAIITDLHIGRGYDDYDSSGFDDSGDGEDYYLTDRLKNVVQWIIDNRNNIDCGDTKCPIKFLAVLGDIADSAEKSEFLKAKKILDRLNDYGIPYIPIFGNHDVWPYTKEKEAESPQGENYFEEIFWNENTTNTKLMKEILGIERDIQNPKYKNFVFNYGGIDFIGLDFNSREKEKCENCGVKGEGILHNETINWLKNKLNEWQGKEPVVIFSHEPFAKPFSRSFHSEEPSILPLPWGNFDAGRLDQIQKILKNYEDFLEGQQILATFGGHIHGYEKFGKEIINQLSPFDIFMDANWQYPSLSTIPVITTEALMVGGNENNLDNKGLVRIVKLNGKENIDFSETEVKIPALNPSISFDFKILPDQLYPCVYFRASLFSKRDFDHLLFDFGDGKSEILGFPQIATIHCYSPLKVSQTYKVELTAIDKETGKAESISKKVEIKKGIIPKVIKVASEIKEKISFTLLELQENALEFGRTMRDKVLILTKPKSPQIPIGIIDVHYEKATADIDLTQLKVEVESNKKKVLLYIPQWPEIIEKEKILFIPK